MFCSECGTKMDEGTRFCPTCGHAVNQQAAQPASQQPQSSGSYTYQPEPEPVTYVQTATQPYSADPNGANAHIPDYLVLNIIFSVLALCCCNCFAVVTGIVGIVFSSGVRTALNAGDLATALSKSKTAKIMMIISIVLVGLTLVYWLIMMVTGGFAAYTEMIQEFM